MTTFLSDIILNNENDIQFKNSAGSNAGKISQTGNDLVLSNDQGDILLGDGASDVYIGDGTNSVDILFEQSGSIKADDNASGVTITLGSNNTNIAFGGAVSFGGGVTAFSAASANTVDLGASATPFLNVYAAHHVGGNSINYATSRGWVEDSVPLSETQVGEFGGNFVKNGDVDENAVVRGQDCFNNKALLWKAIAHDTDDDADGGWNKNITIPANNDIGYLSYVYFMADFTADSATQGGNRDGTVYLGCGTTSGQTLNLNGTNNTNPYFVSQSLFTINNGSPAVANRWYLMVGVIQPYNDETTGTDTISGVYDVETGEKVLSGAEFKMGNNTTTQMHRTYLYYDESGDAGENVYFWNPGFHAIDGSEPKLQDLLKRQTIANTVKVGRDGHNLIDFTTDNQIDFRVADGNRLRLTQTALAPITTDTVSLGTSSLNFSDLFLDSGGVVNFDNGDVTLTHSSDKLKVEGGYFGVGGAPSYNFHVIGTGWAGQGLAVETTDTSKGAVISLVSDRNFQVASRGGTFDIRDVTGSLDDRRFHINSSGNATFSHNVTLPGFVLDGNTITGIDDSDEFTDDDAHIMTSAAINDRFYVPGSTLSAGTINFTGELNFTGNGAKYIDVFTLANSNDFTIRHHNETGNLFENAFKSTANGATYLYHDGNTKLTTKSDGVDITGELQCDTLDVEGNGEANRMTLNGTSFPQLFLINGSGNDQTLQLGVAGGSAYLKKSDATGQVLFRNSNNTDLMTIGMGDGGQVTVLNELQAGSLDINGAADISGNLTVGGTVDGVDIATRDGVLTSTTTTANAALPKTGGTMTGAITLPASNPTNANHATRKAYVDAQVLARKESFILACSDETNDLSASSGTPKVTFRMPYAFTLTYVRATVSTAPVGSTIIVDVKKGGSTIFSTKVSIDANAESSFEATTPRVFAAAASEVSFNEDEEVNIFLDQVGSSTAGKGLKVMLIGQQ